MDGDTADIALLVSADDDVQGVVLVFDWDGSLATGLDLLAADGAGMALENAELVQTRVEDDFMIFAVIMNFARSFVAPANAGICQSMSTGCTPAGI